MSREQDAMSYYETSMERVASTPPPENQKFKPGTRVRIAKDLGRAMSHFPCDKLATVHHTYAHAYGGSDVSSYCVIIDGMGSHAWYYESQLTEVDNP